MNTNHRDICRFESEISQGYIKVSRLLLALFRGFNEPEQISAYYNPPYAASKTFTGRLQYLEKLESMLPSTTEPERVAIHGLRGVGKTQLAIKYAERNRERYNAVFFVDASSETQLDCSFEKLHEVLELAGSSGKDKIELVKRWFTKRSNSNWLLVFDNADRLESIRLLKYIPVTNGHVIVISQDHRVRDGDLVKDTIFLDMMTPEESFSLLQKRAGFTISSEDEVRAAEELAKRMGYLPLALDSSAAFIQHQRIWKFSDYLLLFKKQTEFCLRYPRKNFGSSYAEPLFNVLDINYDAAGKESPHAIRLLLLFAHVDGSCISMEFLRRGTASQWRPGSNGEAFQQTPGEGCVDANLQHLISDQIKFGSAIECLMSLSLIYQSSSDITHDFVMHPLVQLHIRSKLERVEKDEAVLRALAFVAQGYSCSNLLKDFANVNPSMWASTTQTIGISRLTFLNEQH